VIVDTSILFSILLWKGKRFRDVLFSESDVRFYCCRFAIVELFKHKEKLLKYSVLSEEELLEVLYSLLTRLSFFDEQMMTTESVQQAYELCWDVDEKDTPFVALTIELNGWLWTKDDVLKDGLRSKGFDRFFEPD
jgi:predicted nucleic acid-binding protein